MLPVCLTIPVVVKTPFAALSASSIAILILLSGSPSAYANPPSSTLHNKCLAAKDYKGCIEAQSPQKEVFNKAFAYEECYEYMRNGFMAEAAKEGLSDIGKMVSYIPVICNESVDLQQQGYSKSSANSTAISNQTRRLAERNRQREDQFTRDLINTPNPYLPYIFGR